jgi:hypothetical protein
MSCITDPDPVHHFRVVVRRDHWARARHTLIACIGVMEAVHRFPASVPHIPRVAHNLPRVRHRRLRARAQLCRIARITIIDPVHDIRTAGVAIRRHDAKAMGAKTCMCAGT